jgi:hypothetical protein
MHHVCNETMFFFTDDIVASFRLQKTVPELEGNTSKLELDVYAEIGIPNSIVCPCHHLYFHFLICSSTCIDRCLNAHAGGCKFTTSVSWIQLDKCRLQHCALPKELDYIINIFEHS